MFIYFLVYFFTYLFIYFIYFSYFFIILVVWWIKVKYSFVFCSIRIRTGNIYFIVPMLQYCQNWKLYSISMSIQESTIMCFPPSSTYVLKIFPHILLGVTGGGCGTSYTLTFDTMYLSLNRKGTLYVQSNFAQDYRPDYRSIGQWHQINPTSHQIVIFSVSNNINWTGIVSCTTIIK